MSSVARVGDDKIAASHDAVVERFDWPELAISAVIGGDERNPRPPRREERAPSGRAASGMDKVDITLLDQSCEPPRIAPDGQRVLAGDPHFDDLAATLHDRLGHTAAF